MHQQLEERLEKPIIDSASQIHTVPHARFGGLLGRAWTQLGVLGAAVVALYFPVLAYLVNQWYVDANYSHGFLVLPFSAYLIWRNREQLHNIERRPTWLGLLLIFFSIAVLFVGQIGADLFLSR